MLATQKTKYMASTDSNDGDQGLGQSENAMRYRGIIDAVRLIAKTRQQIWGEENLGFTLSPARRMLSNAEDYLLKLADAVLRGEEL
jgi:hypothetical protein